MTAATHTPWSEAFFNGLVRQSHELLAIGYKLAGNKIKRLLQEEEITGHLVDAIKAYLNQPEAMDSYDRIFVMEEERVRFTSRTGKRRQRLDICFEASYAAPRPQFSCEAKVLRKNHSAIGDYTGDEGMMCYIKEEYSAEQPAAAMIGYIQSDDSDYWFAELQRKFKEDSSGPGTFGAGDSPMREQVISDFDSEWVSDHVRSSGSRLKLYHLFLDCCQQV